MPTGHSSGGGSSHSGGGFGGGAGRGTGGAWRGGPIPRGRGVIIINNRPYRMSGGASAGFFVCMVFVFIFIFMAMGGGIMMGNAASTKRRIEYDFVNYQDIVTVAERDASRRVEGRIKSIERGYGRKRIIYEFTYRGQLFEGYSFYVYTEDELDDLDYRVGGEIEIALDLSYQIFGAPDSVPMDFEKFDVDDDGEYLKAGKNFNIGVGLLVGGLVLVVVCFVVSGVVKRKFAKPYEDGDPSAPTEQTDPQTQARYCEYCGSRLKENDDKCPECGARNRK